MTPETKSAYADYIAEAIRYAINETGTAWPKNTFLATNYYQELAELDEIVGMKIFITKIPTSYDFFPVFPAENVDSIGLLRTFSEFLEITPFDPPEEYN